MRIRLFNALLFVMLCGWISADGFTAEAESTVSQWTVFETSWQSEKDYDNPAQDVRTEATVTTPSGQKHTALLFWDGGRTWRLRYSPEEIGEYTITTQSTDESDTGLHGQVGSFRCAAYTGDNPVYKHGSLRLAKSRTHLEYADGTPYFWLADTVWNGALLSQEADWDVFLKNRQEKHFSAIQVVMTPWRMVDKDPNGRTAFTGHEKIAVVPEFYQRIDERIASINEHGMIAVPVLLWAIGGESNPGAALPESERIVLAEYMAARYGAYQVLYFLAGDSDYRKEKAEPWKRIGRAVFGENPRRLTTMHPGGNQWVGDEFRSEPWFHFIGYQSGHGDDDGTFAWLVQGPPSKEWNKEPRLPVINIEPNYENHNGYAHRKVHNDHSLRRASYWSLLVSPTAGVTYGGQGVWGWHTKIQAPADHLGTGLGSPWNLAMNLPGSQQMKYLYEFFDSIEWWRLTPAQETLSQQPGKEDFKKFIAVSKSDNGDLLVAYLPEGGEIQLKTDTLKPGATAQWFHPLTGGRIDAGKVEGNPQTFKTPDLNDWVLCVKGN